jgi:hypothetical protein
VSCASCWCKSVSLRLAVHSCFYSMTARLQQHSSSESVETHRLQCLSGFYTLHVSLRHSLNVINNLQLPFRLCGVSRFQQGESPGNPSIETALWAYEANDSETNLWLLSRGELDIGSRLVGRVTLNLARAPLLSGDTYSIQFNGQCKVIKGHHNKPRELHLQNHQLHT